MAERGNAGMGPDPHRHEVRATATEGDDRGDDRADKAGPFVLDLICVDLCWLVDSVWLTREATRYHPTFAFVAMSG